VRELFASWQTLWKNKKRDERSLFIFYKNNLQKSV